jgi:hypothetical protein
VAYYIFKTRGMQMADHIKIAMTSASMTAADPKSFARFDKS